MRIEVKSLPEQVKALLRGKLEYRKDDIELQVVEKVSAQQWANDGEQPYCALFNLRTNEQKVTFGSWGGGTAGSQLNAVDLDEREAQLLADWLVIKGVVGHHPHATIYAAPVTMAPLLPEKVELTEREKSILNAFGFVSTYKKDMLSSMGVTEGEIGALVSRGLVRRAKNGATSLTVAGKNARQ